MRIPGMLPPIAGVVRVLYPTDPFGFSGEVTFARQERKYV